MLALLVNYVTTRKRALVSAGNPLLVSVRLTDIIYRIRKIRHFCIGCLLVSVVLTQPMNILVSAVLGKPTSILNY
jgi:hypothetical protein